MVAATSTESENKAWYKKREIKKNLKIYLELVKAVWEI